MTFSSFRNKLRWVALLSALILLSLDIYCREYCYQIIISDTVNGPAPFKNQSKSWGFMIVWLTLLIITLLSGLITLPRWQSFLALLTVGLATFLWFYS